MTGLWCELSTDSARAIRGLLIRLGKESEARYTALLQDSGLVLCDAGDAAYRDAGETGALASGTFFAAQQLARRLQENDFTGLHYEGADRHFLLAPAGADTLLFVVFGPETRPAIVRACVRKILPDLVTELAHLGREG